MRRVIRRDLTGVNAGALDQRQRRPITSGAGRNLEGESTWDGARRTKPLVTAATLKHMMGERERCMYCLDSHGTDIEHFWPKTPYPERMFFWPNLLLCCTECGRLKGTASRLVVRGSRCWSTPLRSIPGDFLTSIRTLTTSSLVSTSPPMPRLCAASRPWNCFNSTAGRPWRRVTVRPIGAS